MSTNFKFRVTGGGVFSRLLQCAIIPLAELNFDNVYLVADEFDLSSYDSDPRLADLKKQIVSILDQETLMLAEYEIDAYSNIFNYVLEQDKSLCYQDAGVLPIGQLYGNWNPIEYSTKYQKYKSVTKQLKFRSDIVSQVDNIFHNYDPNLTLGVHVRVKNINGHAHEHTFFDLYKDQIDLAINKYGYEKIYVASDNRESLLKLYQMYGDKIITNNSMLPETEQDDYSKWEFENFFKKAYWRDTIVDCLALARCSHLICRTSNFSNAAIVFGNFKYIQRF
jgi:hypothetical protein